MFDSAAETQNTIANHKSTQIMTDLTNDDHEGLCYLAANGKVSKKWHCRCVAGFSVALVKPSVCQYKHNSLSKMVQGGSPSP